MKYSRFKISAITALVITAFYLINYKYQLSLDAVQYSDLSKNFDTEFFSISYIFYRRVQSFSQCFLSCI